MKRLVGFIGMAIMMVCLFVGLPQAHASEMAAAVLTVPVELEVLKIDGRKARKKRALPWREATYELTPGTHVLEARYGVVVDLEQDDHEVYHSDVVKLALNAKAGETYTLDYDRSAVEGIDIPENTAVAIWVEGAQAQLEEGSSSADTMEKMILPTTDFELSKLDLLKGLWRQADDEEREAFRHWIGAESKRPNR